MDFDGSGLNGHERHPNGYCGSRPDVVARLNRVIAETDCVLVVASAWRYLVLNGCMTVVGLENMLLTHGLDCRNRVAGVVRADAAPDNCDRGRQISDWIRRNGADFARRYAVLDDMPFDIPDCGHPLVLTEGAGMEDIDADELIERLGRKT